MVGIPPHPQKYESRLYSAQAWVVSNDLIGSLILAIVACMFFCKRYDNLSSVNIKRFNRETTLRVE